MPEISRVVVPLLPQSKVSFGACSPWRPFPWTKILSHAAEAADRGETVRSFKEAGDLRGAFSDGAEHDAPMGDGFISRYDDLPS